MASVQTSSYQGRYLKLTVIEESYSIQNNTSTVRWTLESIGGSSNYYSIYQWGVVVNGQTIYSTRNTEWDTYSFPAKKGSSTGTITIQHNPDGTAPDVSFTLKGSVYYNRTNSYSGSIGLTPLHTPPTVSIDSITELNNALTGVANDTFVQHLSQKRFVLSAIPYDDATITGYSVKNGSTIVNNTTGTLDLNINELYVEANVVPIVASASDSMNAVGSIQQNYANYILYQKPTIEPTSTTTKRNGQTSGRCLLNTMGNYWVGQIGSITNTPVVKYRYWKRGTTEPSTWNTVPSASVNLENGRITVTNYEIGSANPSDPNYFDFQFAYDIRVQIEDSFYTTNTLKGITVGEAVWSEYRDRVDFKKLTINGADILNSLNLKWALYIDNGSQTMSQSGWSRPKIKYGTFSTNDSELFEADGNTGIKVNKPGKYLIIIHRETNISGEQDCYATINANGYKMFSCYQPSATFIAIGTNPNIVNGDINTSSTSFTLRNSSLTIIKLGD